LYDQKEGISIDLPNFPEAIPLWWQHINPHFQRHPVIVWGNFGFGSRNFDVLFRDHSDKKRNQHHFALAACETETDVGSTYALIKAYQSVQSNISKKILKRVPVNNQNFDKQISLRDNCVTTFLKEADKVFSDAIILCQEAFSYPECPIVSLQAINSLVVLFYNTLKSIYNWQYCLSVSSRTPTISSVTRKHEHKYSELSVHIGKDEGFVLFSFFAHCRKRNNHCLKHWAIILSFNNMAQGVAPIQQSITNNLGYQLAASSFQRYKTVNRRQIVDS
jgi:hypothetical protein